MTIWETNSKRVIDGGEAPRVSTEKDPVRVPAPMGWFSKRNRGVVTDKIGVVYLWRFGPYYKLGMTTDWEVRRRTYQLYSPFQFTFIDAWTVQDPSAVEQLLLSRYRSTVVRGKKEWLKLNPRQLFRIVQFLNRAQLIRRPIPA